jgi:parallel beta-helix repeat protein
MKFMRSSAAALALLLTIYSQVSTASAQGSLTPAGGPAPIMKTLDQVEPRTPVDSTHAPGTPFAEFVIAQPGSYYFASNIVGVTGKDGIQIAVGNVTLDLNGFYLLGGSNSNNGISVAGSFITNITVRNGTISGWTNAGYYGLESFGRNAVFERLNISGNSEGLYCGGGTTIRNCTVSGNSMGGIFVAGSDCLVLENRCSGNDAANLGGPVTISVAGSNNRIEGNHVSGTGAGGYGIGIIASASYTNNIVIRNSVAGSGALNYSFNASQIVGPLITNTVSGLITNSSPWANFSF